MDSTYEWYIFNYLFNLNYLLFLFTASRYGHIEVAKLLLDRGADIESINVDRGTALNWGICFNYLFNLNYLLFLL